MSRRPGEPITADNAAQAFATARLMAAITPHDPAAAELLAKLKRRFFVAANREGMQWPEVERTLDEINDVVKRARVEIQEQN